MLIDALSAAAASASTTADLVNHHAFVNLASRLHWSVIVSALVLACVAWRLNRDRDPNARSKGFFAYLFPRHIWLHRSALLDYRFVFFDKLVIALLLAGVTLLVVPGAEDLADDIGDEIVDQVIEADYWVVLAYTAVLLLFDDFLRYWTHRMMHTSRVLWQFHKVHHSPEVLVPISQMRHHPVNGIINLARNGFSTAVVTGAFVLMFPGDLNVVTILGVNAGRMVFYLTGGNLRHSHVWLSFGPVLSHIFISPAQHQIHHSKAPEHIDRNFGSQFALWDWMFGTLYVPKQFEPLELGIDADSTERMRTIRGLYVEPVKDAVKVWRARRADPMASRVSPPAE
ncbi:sterol desaturase family protein [Blastomonas sp.]|uniref:sterol desaturase family protein n=1 Tax=Blastomonas sp. TaxID=1909299 RepID=UPI003593D9FB